MKGDRYEFGAIPLVGGLLGVLFLVFAGAAFGLAWFVTLGFALIVTGATIAYLVARSRRQPSTAALVAAPLAHDGTHRVLVVVRDCSTTALARELAARSVGRPAAAFVIAPRGGSRFARWTGDESSYAAARTQLDATLTALADAGLQATGQVGPVDPLQALDDGLREFAADEVVFAAADVVEHRVLEAARTHYAGPVTSIVVDEPA